MVEEESDAREESGMPEITKKRLFIRHGVNEKVLAEAREYPTALIDYRTGQGRYAGDGKRPGMILSKCDWCGTRVNFRRRGHRICISCWDGTRQAKEGL